MLWGLRRTDLDFWRFIFWGMQLSTGMGSLAVHKKLLRLLWKHSYVDKNRIPHLEITAQDRHLPAPIRDRWPQVARRLDYSGLLKGIRIPTLVCVGRFDPQAPVACSEQLAQTIPAASLVIFEQSDHYPFLEERLGFTQVLAEFLSAGG